MAKVELQASLLLSDGWCAPRKCVAAPEVSEGDGRARLRAVFPVAEQREFVIEAEAHAGIPAVFVRSKLKVFPCISGRTPDKAALEKCHRNGIRLTHYVCYTCLLDTEQQVREGGSVYSEWSESIDCETRDLKDHPDWKCMDKDGNVQEDAWGQSFHHPGLLNTCLHQPGLHEAAVRQVTILMEAGYDGVFVDLAGPTVECYGPKFGKHDHEHPDWPNTQAYEELLRKICETVKSYGEDRIVIQNTCVSLMPSHWAWCWPNRQVDSDTHARGFGPGEGYLVHLTDAPGESISSLRYEQLREISEDFDLYRMAEAAGIDARSYALRQAQSLTEFSDNTADYFQVRRELLEALEQANRAR